jgi:hypothetical protein
MNIALRLRPGDRRVVKAVGVLSALRQIPEAVSDFG